MLSEDEFCNRTTSCTQFCSRFLRYCGERYSSRGVHSRVNSARSNPIIVFLTDESVGWPTLIKLRREPHFWLVCEDRLSLRSSSHAFCAILHLDVTYALLYVRGENPVFLNTQMQVNRTIRVLGGRRHANWSGLDRSGPIIFILLFFFFLVLAAASCPNYEQQIFTNRHELIAILSI